VSKSYISFAARAKGPRALIRRVQTIIRHYGLTPDKMNEALDLFIQILQRFDCGASFPLTSVTLQRNKGSFARYHEYNIEFLVHGYTHVDYSQVSPERQLDHLRRARDIFDDARIPVSGFRSPYLRREAHLYEAIASSGFSYISNQPILWDVLDERLLAGSNQMSYSRAIDFYAPWLAHQRASVPRTVGDLVEIPVSLPDDEILVDRLESDANHLVSQSWQRILARTYRRGELFTIQLHPERIAACADGLASVLQEARARTPAVWVARLDEIAAWWRARTAARVDVTDTERRGLRISVAGPEGTRILARGVNTLEPGEKWGDGYQLLQGTIATVGCQKRPFIGVSRNTASSLVDFLRQQGYIVEVSSDPGLYTFYVDEREFSDNDEVPLLKRIEDETGELVRLGRWPGGARSSLAVTGDIDALTLWDYGLRFLGK
jgi:peptidoglycan/xylan/chitin deacetylase (PgdA/CDA1 family)